MGLDFFGLQVDQGTQGDPAMLRFCSRMPRRYGNRLMGDIFCEPGQAGVVGLDFLGHWC